MTKSGFSHMNGALNEAKFAKVQASLSFEDFFKGVFLKPLENLLATPLQMKL